MEPGVIVREYFGHLDIRKLTLPAKTIEAQTKTNILHWIYLQIWRVEN